MDEREFELINIIGAKLGSNQRDLSRQMNLSLGMVNMIIRRLIGKGYIRINQLNKRKVEYILTSKGFSEKMRKSVKYTLKTLSSIGLIKDRIKPFVSKLYLDGERDFVIVGKSDFAMLIEMVFKEMGKSDYKITYVESIPENDVSGTLLICREAVNLDHRPNLKYVNLVQELAKDDFFIRHTDYKEHEKERI